MCIAEIQVVTCGTVHRYSSEVQVEAVLVGQGMASRTEGAGTEAQEKIPVGILKGRMSTTSPMSSSQRALPRSSGNCLLSE